MSQGKCPKCGNVASKVLIDRVKGETAEGVFVAYTFRCQSCNTILSASLARENAPAELAREEPPVELAGEELPAKDTE